MAIFGLFVGINAYPIASHALKGCIADVQAFENYITGRAEQDGLALKKTVLTDKKATRANIIKGFDVFAQAKDGDVCVLYFSGHGSQSPVPKHGDKPMFDETDGMLESIIAYDSRIEGGRDLLDKELAYLIYTATSGKALHFLSIFDCCHAGGNTRNAFVAARARMAEPARIPTAIDDVLGYKEGFLKQNARGYFVPVGENPYISLAAAQSEQTAKEVEILDKQVRGVFTYTLLEVLQQRGAGQTYVDIITEINLIIQNIVKDQNPLAEPTQGSQLQKTIFLNGLLQSAAARPRIAFHKSTNTWRINQGSINGLSLRAKIRLADDKETKMPLTLSELGSNYSLVTEEETLTWDKKTVLIAEIIDLGTPKTLIAFTPTSTKAAITTFKKLLKATPSNFFELTTNNAPARYQIHVADDTFSLLPFGEQMPMFKGVEVAGKKAAAQIKEFYSSIEKVLLHEKVSLLNNPRTTIPEDDIEIEVYKIDPTIFATSEIDANLVPNKKTWKIGLKGEKYTTNAPYLIQYYKENTIPRIRLSITNKSKKAYFIGSVVADGNYTLYNDRIPNKVLRLGSNETQWLSQNQGKDDSIFLPIFYDGEMKGYPTPYPTGITEITVTIKIIISTETFDIDDYNQVGLELAEKAEIEVSRGDDKNTAENSDFSSLYGEPLNDGNWTTKTITFKVQRKPLSQSISPNKKTELLGFSVLGHTACTAKINLTTVAAGTRDLGMAMPAFDNMGLSTFNMNAGFATMPPLNVLELHDIDDKMAKTVTKTNPLVLELDTPLAANEVVIPFGCMLVKDENGKETQWFYPLGGTRCSAGQLSNTIEIQTLPDPIAEGARSLTGALKVFFQKVVLQKKEIQTLREVEITPDPEGGYTTEYLSHSTEGLQKRVAESENIAVFIHGIIGDTEIMVQTMKRIGLENRYDLALAFDYESLDTRIPDTAKAFQELLNEAGINANSTQNIHIIAHSMGGLVSRYMLEKQANPPKIAHLIQLGTPNNGSPWGDVQALVQLFLPRLINSGGIALGVPPFITKAIAFGAGVVFDKINNTLEDMQPDSKFMQALNTKADPKVPLTIIAGNTTLLVQEKAFFARVFSQYTILNTVLFNGANDMAVTVESINKIAGSASRLHKPTVMPIVACDHISYFMNENSLQTLKKAVENAFIA